MDPYSVPEPFVFNGLKHHLGFIRHFIDDMAQADLFSSKLRLRLKRIGHSRIDLYSGLMPPGAIANDLAEKLKSEGISSKKTYKEWIGASEKKYRILDLSDGSRWTFRMGLKSNRHIHLHPARYSPLVSSVKALPLKTAIALLIQVGLDGSEDIELEPVNTIRVEVLGVSPLKSLKRDAGLKEIIDLIRS